MERKPSRLKRIVYWFKPEAVSWKRFALELNKEIQEDNVSNGAAALAYFFLFSIFPALIFLLTLLPYLPIPNLEQATFDLLNQALPGDAAQALMTTVRGIVSHQQGGLLSFGLLLTLWSASSGIYAIMQQLNITYDVVEGRPYWKSRGISILLSFACGFFMILGLSLILFGGHLEDLLTSHFGWGIKLTVLFEVARWTVIASGLSLVFAFIYYWGPDVEQKFRFITPGSVIGVVALGLASVGFKIYVDHFGKYNATYGSLGAVIILMLWLYITGNVILVGSEINSLIEHYRPEGKSKGEKKLPPESSTRVQMPLNPC